MNLDNIYFIQFSGGTFSFVVPTIAILSLEGMHIYKLYKVYGIITWVFDFQTMLIQKMN